MREATGPILRYKLVLAYDGANFHGWQRQKPVGDEDELRTVQGVLEKSLCRLLNQPIVTCGASRTDAGVHALGQVVAFDAASPIPVERIKQAIANRLADDIDVIDAEIVDSDFDPIRDVSHKLYRFRIFNASRRPLWLRNYVCHIENELDVKRMNSAAALLVGEHNFAGFAASGHGRKSTVRHIFKCEVVQTEDEIIDIYVCGNGFLWNMVRIIAGTLVEVGRGKFEPEHINKILSAKDRRLAGPTLGPQGLRLEWIQY